jgi:hypothetical protein
MKSTVLFTVPKVIVVRHYPEAHACVASWEDLSSPQFREICTRGLGECGRLGARSWIVDLTGKNPGVPTQADLGWISSDCIEIAKDNGVVAVINVHGKSHIASMGAKRWSKLVGDGGLGSYDCSSVQDALTLAAEIAGEKAEQE